MSTLSTAHLSSYRAGYEKQCPQNHQALPFAPHQSAHNTHSCSNICPLRFIRAELHIFWHFKFCKILGSYLTITEQGVYDTSVRLNPELHDSCDNIYTKKITYNQALRLYYLCKAVLLKVSHLKCWVYGLRAERMVHKGPTKQAQLTPRHCTDL